MVDILSVGFSPLSHELPIFVCDHWGIAKVTTLQPKTELLEFSELFSGNSALVGYMPTFYGFLRYNISIQYVFFFFKQPILISSFGVVVSWTILRTPIGLEVDLFVYWSSPRRPQGLKVDLQRYGTRTIGQSDWRAAFNKNSWPNVLGIDVSAIFDCWNGSTCPAQLMVALTTFLDRIASYICGDS